MNKFRKEGSIYLLALFYFLFVALLLAIFLSLLMMTETYQRVQTAADTGARTRALAVNIPLKEQYGIIETFRSSNNYNVNYEEPSYSFNPTSGYDLAVLDPASESYKAAFNNANSAAKQAVISSINDSLGTNEKGERIVNLQPENVCIQVLPLPAGEGTSKKSKLNFTCSATVNGKAVQITANNVEVYGYNHELNKSKTDELKVYNVVFVGVAYQDNHMFYRLLQNIVNGDNQSNWNSPPVRGTYAIAYPQIDECTAQEC